MDGGEAPRADEPGEAAGAGSPADADVPVGAEAPAGADAAAAEKTRPARLVRPPWTGWVYYLVGGTLPPTYSTWVSHDLTAPGWRLRQAMRTGLLLLPVAVVFALLPGPPSVRLTIVGFVVAAALGIGFGTGGYFRNRRLLQHGFPPVFPEEDRAPDRHPDD
jgi:hypothetical protein